MASFLAIHTKVPVCIFAPRLFKTPPVLQNSIFMLLIFQKASETLILLSPAVYPKTPVLESQAQPSATGKAGL